MIDVGWGGSSAAVARRQETRSGSRPGAHRLVPTDAMIGDELDPTRAA